MIYEIKGRVVSNSGIITKGKFSYVEIVLDISESKYQDYAVLQGSGPLILRCSALAVGDLVEARFKISGRQWVAPSGEVKYFSSLRLVSLAPLVDQSTSIPFAN